VITPNFCPTSPGFKYHPYRARKSVIKNSIMEHDKGMLTAVAAMPYHDNTVVFIGTDQGQLLKV